MLMISALSFVPGHMEEQPGARHDSRVGIVLILLSALVQAAQYVVEERLMSEDLVPPLMVVGLEGAWGSLLMPLIVLPWAGLLPGSDAGGCLENVVDAWAMIESSGTV